MTSRLVLFRRLALAGVLLALVVVVLGAWVRLSAAGLGCPDWPGCYGHLTVDQAAQNVDAINEAFPHRPFEYHKAIKEMVHRYFASGLGLLILVLAGLAIANRKDPNQPVGLPIALVALVIFQGLLGMWTVTLLLKPLIVVLHLLGGLATLSLLAWLAIDPERRTRVKEETGIRRLAFIGLIVLGVQIALGGWTSSNYAALACPDFPTCQNVAWPHMDIKDAFVLWRGLGIDYEGGVLDHPARVAIHFIHRLGALATALILGWLAIQAWRKGRNTSVKVAGAVLGAVLLMQLILGPLMVVRALPLSLATAHNGVAALLLLSVVRLNRLLRPLPSRL
ncbi:MAG TPA: COX15/CtaA family protein [Povalibacter sp.]|uniref:COX15/CtaA family protein n=1 Tax=Povalibacter sp. TaxID=1962978 RepID=UPI002B64234F|nr:COX15/CtaA family protein [Povalibacter sp.]HMN44704.1 COX15/CtaA family protein [Povalibacter sp.]